MKILQAIFILSIFLFSFITYGQEGKIETKKIYQLKEREELSIHKGRYEGNFFIIDNKGNVAFDVVTEGGEFVIINDQESKEYDAITDFLFFPDGKGFAYVAREAYKYFVIIHDQEGKKYDYVSELYLLDDNRLLYKAQEGEKYMIVIDGKEGEKYDDISYLQFSSDSKRFAYKAKEGEKYVVVVDSQESKKYDDVYFIQFSPDSQRFAYIAREDREKFFVLDGIENKRYFDYSSINDNYSYYDLDAYYRDKDDIFSYHLDELYEIVFAPNGKEFAYKLKKGDKYFVVFNNKEGKLYDKVYELKFSPDGKELSYIVDKRGRYFLVINGKEEKPLYYDRFYLYHINVLFNSDSKIIASDVGWERYEEKKIYS